MTQQMTTQNSFSDMEIRYLQLLAKSFPSIAAASTEIINLEAILNFSLEVNETPGVCSPSRKVVSKTLICIKSPKDIE